MAKGNKKKEKNNKEDMINYIFDLRIKQHLSWRDIKDVLMTAKKYTERVAQQYIKWTKEYIGSQWDEDRKFDIQEAIEELEFAARDAYQSGNKKLYLEFKKEIYKLKSLITQQVDLTSGGEPINFSFRIIKTKDEEEEK